MDVCAPSLIYCFSLILLFFRSKVLDKIVFIVSFLCLCFFKLRALCSTKVLILQRVAMFFPQRYRQYLRLRRRGVARVNGQPPCVRVAVATTYSWSVQSLFVCTLPVWTLSLGTEVQFITPRAFAPPILEARFVIKILS